MQHLPWLFFGCAAATCALACGANGVGETNGSFGGAGGSTASTTSSASGGASSASGNFTGSGGNNGPYVDFPKNPMIDGTDTPADAPMLFGAATSGEPSGGPCLVEPELGALFPQNWLRPRFRWIPTAGENLFELRVHTQNEINDLVVYTTATSWTMPKAMWSALSTDIVDQPITITIRGAVLSGTTLSGQPAKGSSGDVRIAPAQASGAIVYWTTTGGSSLKGFQVGDESVISVLTPNQVQMRTVGGKQVTCVGCHTSTPDGKYAGFTAESPWGNALASIEAMTVGAMPSFMSTAAQAALQQSDMGIETFSKAHWTNGDHIEIAPLGAGTDSQLAWFDLEGGAEGTLARNGDARGVGAPAWSHDGKTIVYVSTDAEFTGRLDQGVADLYAVPYNNRAGGTAKPIPGASDPTLSEYYPTFSADDHLLAFNRIPSSDNMYNQPNAEVFVMPAGGGTPMRITANDPPACSGKTSPGVTNSWPKWSPEATTVGTKTYYWLIFSSTRGDMGNPQLYVTGVVVDGTTTTTYGSLYLWNQPPDENNHTPAWDVFKIPPTQPN